MVQREEHERAQAIIVMGVAGSGKSTLASLLAQRFGCSFFEGDDFHSDANVAKMRRGEPLVDADRWPWLDALGAATRSGVKANGLAVAACSALRRVYRDRLRAVIGTPVRFVLLEAEHDELVRRLSQRPGHYMPASLLGSQLATLEPPGADESALTLCTDPPAEVLVEEVAQWLATHQQRGRQQIAQR